jgi:hypothetical protein
MAEERTYFVYILSSRPYGTLYIGITNDLYRRMTEHREGRVPGFTRRDRVRRWSGSIRRRRPAQVEEWVPGTGARDDTGGWAAVVGPPKHRWFTSQTGASPPPARE